MTKKRFLMHIHPAGIVVLAGCFLFYPSTQVLAAFIALLWHESAHLLLMLLCGIKKCDFELTPFGCMADAREFEKLPPFRQAICAFSGVAASLTGAYLCLVFLQKAPFVRALCSAHFSLAFMNCMPVWPLDGARVLIALGMKLGCENGMRRCLASLAVLLGCGMVMLGLYGAWKGYTNFSLLLCGPYLCYTSRMGNVAERVRRFSTVRPKLKGRDLPVRIFASTQDPIQPAFAEWIGRFSSSRYYLAVQVNEQDGKIKRIWTENEMTDAALGMESIGVCDR